MADAQSMQEELQQSVILSEEDPDHGEYPDHDSMAVDQPAPMPSDDQSLSESQMHLEDELTDADREVRSGDIKEQSRVDNDVGAATRQEEGPEQESEEGDDADGEDGAFDSENDAAHDDGDAVFEDDAGGEEDEEAIIAPRADPDNASEGNGNEDEDEDEEIVGAVKIKPGETDDEDMSEESVSDVGSSNGDSAADWEEAVENGDSEDDESEVADTSTCIFCKKGEEADPGEEFEAYLVCKACGEHAHQQCARDADALEIDNGSQNWKCPDCVGDDAGLELGLTHQSGDVVNESIEDGELSPTSARLRSTAPKIARDLLPPSRGTNKPDSHSVFNQLVLDEDPMDGSRVLRKRKTSSVEADENVMSLRKRRKITADDLAQDEAHQEKANGHQEPTRPHSVRSLRLKISNPAALCTVMKRSRTSLLLKMRVSASDLKQILSQRPKSEKRRGVRAAVSRPSRNAAPRSATAAEPSAMAPFFETSFSQPFYSLHDKETDELKGKPYGGILTEAEADTSKTLPTKDDRRRFDEAKQKAEEEWRDRLLAMQAEMEVPVKKSKKSAGPASQIECIEFGGWEIDTWYAAPYPEEYSRNRVLYICEFCLKYMNSDYVAWRHKLKCPAKHPPGDEIYRHDSVSMFEVDGRKNPVYCQNLCLLAKLFLGSKTLYYDVEPFLFYVLCEYDDMGYHFVGYFSKEKRASSQNNVSCILTLPIHQRKGYGNLLIDFSYLLTRVEEKTGSPEKPLSDMGLVSYRNYWRLVMCRFLLGRMESPLDGQSRRRGLSIRQISDNTGMTPDDVISALEGLRCLVRDPVTQLYAFRVDTQFCREYVGKWESKKYVQLEPTALTWTPYVMGRSMATNFELGPALNAIAPREEDEEAKPAQVLAQSGISTGDFAKVGSDSRKSELEPESSILESTEPNDNAMAVDEETKADGVGKENVEPSGAEAEANVDVPTGSAAAEDAAAAAAAGGAETEAENPWWRPYKDIPATRFQVFPPTGPKRPGPPRINSSIARPSLPRPPATAPPRRPRQPTLGSTRKVSSSTKKASSARRRTGGTGRGPGRWPKGTKKSDYGNAASGPGLPPAWIEAREKQKVASLGAPRVNADAGEKDGGGAQIQDNPAVQASDTIEAKVERNDDHEPETDLGEESDADEETGNEGDNDADMEMGENGGEEDEDADAEGDDV